MSNIWTTHCETSDAILMPGLVPEELPLSQVYCFHLMWQATCFLDWHLVVFFHLKVLGG